MIDNNQVDKFRTNSVCKYFTFFPEIYHVLNNTHRPVSAPPGKFDFLSKISCASTPRHNADLDPDSPRVLEVYEKNESVSWKLEYNEAEAEMCGSPNLKRKLSPHSPLTIRKSRNGKPHPGGDIMSRFQFSFVQPCK
jgi:hypothetical protein